MPLICPCTRNIPLAHPYTACKLPFCADYSLHLPMMPMLMWTDGTHFCSLLLKFLFELVHISENRDGIFTIIFGDGHDLNFKEKL